MDEACEEEGEYAQECDGDVVHAWCFCFLLLSGRGIMFTQGICIMKSISLVVIVVVVLFLGHSGDIDFRVSLMAL